MLRNDAVDFKSLRPLALIGGMAAIAIGIAACYWPAIHGAFLFDDDKLITDNSVVQAADGLQQIWFTTAHDYWPLTNSLFWFEWRLFGSNPTGYHATSLLLHAAAASLIWALLRRLSIPAHTSPRWPMRSIRSTSNRSLGYQSKKTCWQCRCSCCRFIAVHFLVGLLAQLPLHRAAHHLYSVAATRTKVVAIDFGMPSVWCCSFVPC